MEKNPLFTIGHGNRKPEDFLALLKGYGIEYVIDVRSQPYSRFNPQFNRDDLKFFLQENGIKYVFMGDSIGGRPADLSCYTDGKVDYEIVKTKGFFLEGMERLKTAYRKDLNVVIMCSESDPCDCHRSKLIGKVLDHDDDIVLQHIDEKGKLKDQIRVINDLNKGRAEIDLFGDPVNSTSRKAYI